MAQIPIGGLSTQFYTFEARGFAGYDTQIPGEAIMIHNVDTTRSDRLAQVVDADNNGNPNDAGAMYLSADTVLDFFDLFLTSLGVSDSLEAGEEVELSGRLRVSGPTSGQFLLAVMDANGEVEETDEGNNVVAGEIP